MNQNQIDKMNASLCLGLINPKIQTILNDGYKLIGKFMNSHGHIAEKDAEKDFDFILNHGDILNRGDILHLMMDDIAIKCL